MTDFSGRTVLLTGASGGIGRAIAEVFYAAGGNVLLADINEDALRKTAQEIDPQSKRTQILKYDAARPEDAEAAVKLCLDRFSRIDFVVPAAGVFENHPFLTMTDAQWRRAIAINLDGVFYIVRRAVPAMSEGGSIVMIASEAAHIGASIGRAHYGAAKGGVVTFARSIARELAPKIRVNTVSPGTIETPMVDELMRQKGEAILQTTPMKRLGAPHEIADAVAFLCSDAATYITGQVIHVNGGSYIGG